MSVPDLASLHEEASRNYLQGDFPAALDAWSRLLVLEPGDEQALEGVRLCRQLIGDQADVPVEGEAEAEAEDLLDDLGDLGPLEALGPGGIPVQPSAAAEDTFALEDDLLDLGSGKNPLEEASEFDLTDLMSSDPGEDLIMVASDDEPLVPIEIPASSDAERAAAGELRHRVNALLAEALAAMEREDPDEALTILSRVLILDEENESALGLKAKLEAEQPIPLAMTPPAEPSVEAPAPREEVPLAPMPPPAPIAAPPSPGPPPAAPPLLLAELGPGPTPPREHPVAPAPGAFRPRLSIGKPLLAGVGGALVIGALVFAGWRLLAPSAGSAPPVASERPVAAVAAASTERPDPALPPLQVREEVPIAEMATEPRQRAAAAMREEDWSAAVLAYDEALKLEPDDPGLREGLKLAGERYHERRQREERWEQIADGFRTQNYRNALHVLYRLPPGEDATRAQRLIRDGWYNLGVLALQMRDCPAAQEHLREAEAIAAGDRDVAAAGRLARSCATERTTESFAIAVGALKLRQADS